MKSKENPLRICGKIFQIFLKFSAIKFVELAKAIILLLFTGLLTIMIFMKSDVMNAMPSFHLVNIKRVVLFFQDEKTMKENGSPIKVGINGKKKKAQLLDASADGRRDVGEETIKAHMRNLRCKLTAAGAAPDLIETVYGLGYRLNPALAA